MNNNSIQVTISFGHCVLLEFYSTMDWYQEYRERIAGWKDNKGCVRLAIQNEEFDINPDFVQLQRIKPVAWEDIPDSHRDAIQAYGSSLIRFVEGGGVYASNKAV